MFRKAVLSIFLISCLIGSAVAQTNYNPGLIKPDSFLWQLDLQIERLHEQIQFDQNTRIKLQLQHADERMGELQQNTNTEAVANEYNAILERIRTNERVNYLSNEQIKTKMEEHNIVLINFEQKGNYQLQTSSQLNSELRLQAKTNQQTISSDDLTWWQDLIKDYPIVDAPTSLLTMLDTDMSTIHSYIPTGITQITITQENGNTVQSYIVTHSNTDILISKGVTTNPAQLYTFTIQDVQEYKNTYGGIINL